MIYYVNPVEIVGQVASFSSDVSEMFVSTILNDPILCVLFVLIILLSILSKFLELKELKK